MQVRTLVGDDFADAIELDAAAFGYDPTDAHRDELILPLLRSSRPIGVHDDDRLVGIAAILDKELTYPGGTSAPVAAVTWVSVRPGDQRRGVLRELMRTQLHGLHDERREPVAILTASESGIYGRFGYGNAVSRDEATMPTGLAFRPGVVIEPVREVGAAEALPVLRAVHERLRPTRAGYLSRSDDVWGGLYRDLPSQRAGAGSIRFAVHPDGALAFRITMHWGDRGPRHSLAIHELAAATPTAAASLWHHVLNRAMVREVTYLRHGPDEILQDLLVDPRAVQGVTRDHIWLRIVDLDRTVPLRSYSADASLTVGVRDAFCPWNDGTWALDLGTGGGTATRSDRTPDLTIDIADLAATFLGGTRLARLADAGLVSGDPDAIAALDLALATPRAPYCPEGF